MKPIVKKPGFELIFALSLITIMALPPIVFAQNRKDIQIRITNGDTVINGKNIKQLSGDERKQALKDIDNLGNISGPPEMGKGMKHRLFIRKHFGADSLDNRITLEKRRFDGADREMADGMPLRKDSTGRTLKFRMKRMGDKDSAFAFNYRLDADKMHFDDREWNSNNFHRGPRMMEFMHHRNTQTFNYTNTGTDGISTHVSFRVTDPSPEKLKEMGGIEKNALEIKDLNLVPEFSSGKTTLMFSLPSRAMAEVKLTDHDGKLMWSDKAMNGSFSKSFALGLNGIYFLQVKQAGKVVVKRIIKEE
jgi:hypothetical protein